MSFLAIGCFLVLRPFLSALMWAVILCYASWPAYTWLEQRLGGRRTLTAILMTVGVAAILVLPFVIVGFTLAENVSAFLPRRRSGGRESTCWIDCMRRRF